MRGAFATAINVRVQAAEEAYWGEPPTSASSPETISRENWKNEFESRLQRQGLMGAAERVAFGHDPLSST